MGTKIGLAAEGALHADGGVVLTRTLVLMVALSALAYAAPKRRDWQIGRLEPGALAYVDHDGGRQFNGGEGTPTFDTATFLLTIHAGNVAYKAAERAATTVHVDAVDAAGVVSLERSVDAASVLPWVSALPPAIHFAVEGKNLYYLDGRGKEHKAKIIAIEHSGQ